MKPTYIYIAVIVIVIGGIVLARNASDGGGGATKVTAYDTFAQCLSDAGAQFYGAYWCPHCADQKKLFDNSKKIPYIECSTPDGKAQTQVCIDQKIQGYPTWVFSDGERVDRVMQLSELSEKTNCAVPQI